MSGFVGIRGGKDNVGRDIAENYITAEIHFISPETINPGVEQDITRLAIISDRKPDLE